MGQHPDFRDAINEAELISQLWSEDLGVEGMLGKVPRFNTTSYIFQMKNRIPEDYGYRRVVTGLGEGAIESTTDRGRTTTNFEVPDLTEKLAGIESPTRVISFAVDEASY